MNFTSLPKEKYLEVKRMTDYNRVSYFTGFHQDRDTFFDSQFNPTSSFTEKLIAQNKGMMLGKIVMITGASAGFGFAMGFIMSGFEFNSTRVVNTERSSRS